MSDSLITCPACHKTLRSDRPVPAGATLRCPECRAGFSAPELVPEPEPQRLFGPLFVAAVAFALILGGAVIAAAVLITTPRPASVAKTDDRPLADDQKKLDDARRELDDAKRELERSRLAAQGEAARTAAVTKADDDARKRDAERDRLVADGKKALADGRTADAVRALEAAKAVAPGDVSVLSALDEAKATREADDANKKRRVDHDARIAAGRNALEAGRIPDAVREFAAALALLPDSMAAKDGQRQAEAKLAALGDREKTEAAFQAALTRAKEAMAATRFGEAVTAMEGAMRLIPDDKEGARLLKDARTTMDKVKASNAKLLAAANVAAANGQLDEAARLAERASKAWAEDDVARRAFRKAETLTETTRASQDAYFRYVQAGALAMSTGQWADAVVAYTEALKLNPTNDEVSRQLRNARIALENYQRHRIEYERLLRSGQLALSRNSFAEAARAFQAAMKLLPDDLAARDGLSRARFGSAMLEGQQALLKRMRPQALAAFEAALAERPGDGQAQLGLMRARAMR